MLQVEQRRKEKRRMVCFDNEPVRFVDEYSGIEMLQLVSDAALSRPLSYDWPSVTPDNRRAIIYCEFSPESGRPTGFYRIGTDGSDLTFLIAGDVHPRMTIDGRHIYTVNQSDTVIYRTDVDTGECVEVCDIAPLVPEGFVYAQTRLSPASNHLYVHLRVPDITPIRVDLSTGEAVKVPIDGMLWACTVDEPRLIVIRQKNAIPGKTYGYIEYRKLEKEPGDRSIWSLDVDGGDEQFLCTDYYSHATMLGRTSYTQGCGKWSNRSITIAGNNDERREVCSGPYFWHSGASFDAEWIAADTNWPEYGIQLVHVATGNFRYLCDPATSLKTGLLHAHPSLSNDGRIMMYRSDRSGTCQAYLVHIPESLRESVIACEAVDCQPVRFEPGE
jgi:hypothetical protein